MMDQASGLRNIIKASQTRPLARVITVTSGKGGVGKSNTAINLAVQFRKMGQRVIILDADFGLANIEIMFGAVPKHNLFDLIYKGLKMEEIITRYLTDGRLTGGNQPAVRLVIDDLYRILTLGIVTQHLLQNLHATVWRTVIDEYVLYVLVRLCEEGAGTSLYKCLHTIDWCTNRNFYILHQNSL